MVGRKLRRDLVGVGLGIAFAVWVGVAAIVAGGNPGPMIGVGLGSIAAVIIGARVAKNHFLVVPLFVAGFPIVALLFHGSSFLERGVLGYANASASLYFVAACAAVTVALSLRGVATRTAAWTVAGVWIVIPWMMEAIAAAILGTLLPLAVVLVQSTRMARRLVIAGGGLPAVALMSVIALGSANYRPTEGATSVDQWFDENVSEVRVTLWGTALDLIRENPIAGVGPGEFPEESAATVSPADPMPTHNEYLQVAAEGGIIAGLILLSMAVWGFVRLWPAASDLRSVPALVALSGVSLHANIDFIWHFPEVPVAVGLLVGGASATTKEEPSETGARISVGTRTAVVGTFILCLALLSPCEIVNPPNMVENHATFTSQQRGIRFPEPGLVRSLTPPRSLMDHMMSVETFAIELSVTPYVLGQGGPARIVSISDGTDNRNLTVGQEGDRLVVRLRTTETDLNGLPQLEVRRVFTSTETRHIVISTSLDRTRVFVDGILRWSGAGPGGALHNWNRNHSLLIGNESTGNRPWIGRLGLLAFHDRAIDGEEVARTYSSSSAGTRNLGPETRTAGVVALYTFEEPSDSGFADMSGSGFSPPLVIPREIPSPVQGPYATIFGSGSKPATRLAAHSVLFGIWGTLLLIVAVPRPFVRHGLTTIVGGGILISGGASVLRYLAGYSPAIWDLIGAGAGCVLALLLALALSSSGAGKGGAPA